MPGYFTMPSMSRSGGPNFLGAKYAPFVVANDPNSEQFRVRDVEVPKELLSDRFGKRQDLRKLVDRLPSLSRPRSRRPRRSLRRKLSARVRSRDDAPKLRRHLIFTVSPRKCEKPMGRNSFGQRGIARQATCISRCSVCHDLRWGMGPPLRPFRSA